MPYYLKACNFLIVLIGLFNEIDISLGQSDEKKSYCPVEKVSIKCQN